MSLYMNMKNKIINQFLYIVPFKNSICLNVAGACVLFFSNFLNYISATFFHTGARGRLSNFLKYVFAL